MNNINERVFSTLAATLDFVPVMHRLPQMLSEVPCVTFSVNESSPAVFADDTVYLKKTVVDIDIWSAGLEEAERICESVCLTMESGGFCFVSGADNTNLNQFRKHDNLVRRSLKFSLIL